MRSGAGRKRGGDLCQRRLPVEIDVALVAIGNAAVVISKRIVFVRRRPVARFLIRFLRDARSQPARAAHDRIEAAQIFVRQRMAHIGGDVEIHQRFAVVRHDHGIVRNSHHAPCIGGVAAIELAARIVAEIVLRVPNSAEAAIGVGAVAIVAPAAVVIAGIGGVDLPQLDKAVRAAAGKNVDDAVARILALRGRHQQHEFLLLGQRTVEIVGDGAPRIAVGDVLADARADAREVVPDIGFDRIVIFAAAALVAIDIAELDLGQEVIVPPGGLAPDADAGLRTDPAPCDHAVGEIGARDVAGEKNAGHRQHHTQPEDQTVTLATHGHPPAAAPLRALEVRPPQNDAATRPERGW